MLVLCRTGEQPYSQTTERSLPGYFVTFAPPLPAPVLSTSLVKLDWEQV